MKFLPWGSPMDWKPPNSKNSCKDQVNFKGIFSMDWHGLAYSKISRSHHEPSGTLFFSMGRNMVKPAKTKAPIH